jgi:hypothetical protein
MACCGKPSLKEAGNVHDHLVTLDAEKGCIRVFRVLPDGQRTLFTEYALPRGDQQGWTDQVTQLAHVLGEDVFMDSVTLRERFSL